jgi:transglutaminase-like putative cysteine protease
MKRRIPLAPAEGWLTLGLVLLICETMAWALDDARWVLGQPDYLNGLAVVAAGGVLVGFIGPKVGWGRWLTYLIGCLFAALIVPLLVGQVAFLHHEASIHDLYQATASAVVRAYIDLAILNLSTTTQYLHYIFVFGMLVWATAMFASYAVFGHHRPLNAVVVVGVVVVGNMTLTRNDELPLLVVFSLASLFLLIRGHVFDEQSEWLRRRIGDPASISSVYLRGGTVFIGVAVASSVLLTHTAASAPLAGAWDGVQDGVIALSRSVSRFLPTGGSSRPIGIAFGEDAPVGQQWTTSGATAVTIGRNPTDKGFYYWRARVYDKIDLKGFGHTNATAVVIPAGARVLDKLADDIVPDGRHTFTFTVNPVDFRESTMLSPATPIQVNENVRLTAIGQGGYFATLDRDGGSGPYQVTALTLVAGNDRGQENVAALRAAGTDYPQEVRDLYLGVTPGIIGPYGAKLEQTIVDRVTAAGPTTPYDLAKTLVNVLQAAPFQYSTDITNLDCANVSMVECFAQYKTGFCQYYAATMAVILRDLKVPTRIAEGFLPGPRDPNSATEQVPFSNAHAWVEVYFPGFGWVPFDPTGNNLAQIAPLPSGPPVASSGPRSSSGPLPLASRKLDVDPGFLGSSGSFRPPGGALGPLVAMGVLLLGIVGLLAFVTWRRGPRGATSPDGAYGSVTRIASRFGFGPRPTQTVYEFTGALGDVLPTVRPELETVARAKVESVYAREILGEERIAGLRAAQRRLRVSLLRLAFHRKERPRRRR